MARSPIENVELRSGEHKPHIEFRGIKFNIPIDVPTPSYSDTYEGNF